MHIYILSHTWYVLRRARRRRSRDSRRAFAPRLPSAPSSWWPLPLRAKQRYPQQELLHARTPSFHSRLVRSPQCTDQPPPSYPQSNESSPYAFFLRRRAGASRPGSVPALAAASTVSRTLRQAPEPPAICCDRARTASHELGRWADTPSSTTAGEGGGDGEDGEAGQGGKSADTGRGRARSGGGWNEWESEEVTLTRDGGRHVHPRKRLGVVVGNASGHRSWSAEDQGEVCRRRGKI
jgi:hypothetical protein